jgi:predicted ABC-class ATPase
MKKVKNQKPSKKERRIAINRQNAERRERNQVGALLPAIRAANSEEARRVGEVTKAALNFMLALCPSLRDIQIPFESPKAADVQDETDKGAM